jgi:hypothetical protein
MLDALDGLVFLVAQLALLLVVAALLGLLAGRHVWARGRISRLEAEVGRLRAERVPVPAAPPAPRDAPPSGPWIPGYPDA